MRAIPTPDFDLELSREEITDTTIINLIDMLRTFTFYGLCRHGNASERKSLAEKFESLAMEAMKKFPTLKLNYCGAKTIITDSAPCEHTDFDETQDGHLTCRACGLEADICPDCGEAIRPGQESMQRNNGRLSHLEPCTEDPDAHEASEHFDGDERL